MPKLKCKSCRCESTGVFEIKKDETEKHKWDKEHALRLELRAEQELIEAEFEAAVIKHNAGWFGLRGLFIPLVTSKCEGDTLSILNMFGGKAIKQVAFDDSVMHPWLNFIHRKPLFEYIECPVCQCKNYLDKCR